MGALHLAGGVLKASLNSVLRNFLGVVTAEVSLGGRSGVVWPSRPNKNKQRDQGEKALQRELNKKFSRPRLLPPDRKEGTTPENAAVLAEVKTPPSRCLSRSLAVDSSVRDRVLGVGLTFTFPLPLLVPLPLPYRQCDRYRPTTGRPSDRSQQTTQTRSPCFAATAAASPPLTSDGTP